MEALYNKIVDRVNAKLARHESIRAIHILDRPFTSDEDLITPSLKIKRGRVRERYSAEIASLYAIGQGRKSEAVAQVDAG